MENTEKILQWLKANREGWRKQCKTLAILQFSAAAVIFLGEVLVLATFLAVFPGMALGIPLSVCYLLAAALIAGLTRLHWQIYSEDDDFVSTATDSVVGILTILLTIVLFSVAVLIRNGKRNLLRARDIGDANIEACAQVLEVLVSHERAVPFAVIEEELPEIMVDLLLPDLERIDGVLQLAKEPPGLALTESLREELERALAAK